MLNHHQCGGLQRLSKSCHVKYIFAFRHVAVLGSETAVLRQDGPSSWSEPLQIDLSDNEFITDNNLAYVKPAVIRDKQHHVCMQ